jgi:hypothetical protein
MWDHRNNVRLNMTSPSDCQESVTINLHTDFEWLERRNTGKAWVKALVVYVGSLQQCQAEHDLTF